MMRRFPIFVLLVAIAALCPYPAGAAGEGESLRDRLVRRVDERLKEEMEKLRAVLVEEIDRALAEAGVEEEMPDGFGKLLDDVKRTREELVRRPRTAGRSATPRAILGAGIGPVPEAISAQLGLPAGGLLVTRVPAGSAAVAFGLEKGDIVLSVNGGPARAWDGKSAAAEITLVRGGKRLVLPLREDR